MGEEDQAKQKKIDFRGYQVHHGDYNSDYFMMEVNLK
jgi:hypothetical protein